MHSISQVHFGKIHLQKIRFGKYTLEIKICNGPETLTQWKSEIVTN